MAMQSGFSAFSDPFPRARSVSSLTRPIQFLAGLFLFVSILIPIFGSIAPALPSNESLAARGDFPPAPPIDADEVEAATGGMKASHVLLASELLRLVTVREVLGAACPETASGQVEGVDLYVISKEQQQTSGGDKDGDWASSVAWREYVSGLCGDIDAEGAGVPVRRVLLVRRLRYSAPLQRVGLGRSHAAAVAHFLTQGLRSNRDSSLGTNISPATAAIVIEEGVSMNPNATSRGRRVVRRALRDTLNYTRDMKIVACALSTNAPPSMGSRSFIPCNDQDGVDPNVYDWGILNLLPYNESSSHLLPQVIDIALEPDFRTMNASTFLSAYAVRRKFAAKILMAILLDHPIIFEHFDVIQDEKLRAEGMEVLEKLWRNAVAPASLVPRHASIMVPTLIHHIEKHTRWCTLSEPLFNGNGVETNAPLAESVATSTAHGNSAISSSASSVDNTWKTVFLFTMDDYSEVEEPGSGVNEEKTTGVVDWKVVQAVISQMNLEYRVQLVTEGDAEYFLETSFPQHFELYAAMRTWRARVVLLRYLMLFEFGGIVIDSAFKPIIRFNEILQIAHRRFAASVQRNNSLNADNGGDVSTSSVQYDVTEVFVKSTADLHELSNGLIISTRRHNTMFLKLVERMAELDSENPSLFSDNSEVGDFVVETALAKLLYSEVHAVYGDAMHGETRELEIIGGNTGGLPFSSDKSAPDDPFFLTAFDADPCFTARYRGYTDLPCDFAAVAAAGSVAASATVDIGGTAAGSDRDHAADDGSRRAYFMLEQRISRYEEIYVIKVDDETPAVFSNGRRNWPPKVGSSHFAFNLEV